LLNGTVEVVEGKPFPPGKNKIETLTFLGGRGGEYNYWGAVRPRDYRVFGFLREDEKHN